MSTRDFSPTVMYIEAGDLPRIYAMTGHRLHWSFDTYNYTEFLDEPSTYNEDDDVVVLLSAVRERITPELCDSFCTQVIRT